MKVFGIAGFSNSGKTTLIEKLIPVFNRHGLKVSVIKHAITASTSIAPARTRGATARRVRAR